MSTNFKTNDYLGLLPKEAPSGLMLRHSVKNYTLPTHFLTYFNFDSYPSKYVYQLEDGEYLAIKNFMKILKEQFNHKEENDVFRCIYDKKSNYYYNSERLMKIGDGIILELRGGELLNQLESTNNIEKDVEDFHEVVNRITFFYLPGQDELLNKLTDEISKRILKLIPERLLYVVCKNNCGFYLTDVNIKKPNIKDIKMHYGDDFEAIHEKILKGLEKKEGSGIVLLHGEPGTGKTHYIRYLIQEIKDKKLIYIPPDLATSIASPEFFPFMLENSDSILIIEDAENIIKDRIESGQTTQAVANILNLSDGLLGDSLHQPIIATFNCEVSKIDSALLRNGRLIAAHDFKKLNTEQAQKLSNELGFNTKITQPMTLADIYAQQK